MRAVGIVVLALIAFFVIKSIVSWLISLLVTVAVIGLAIWLLSALVGQKAKS